MARRIMPPQDYLRECITYDPDTGQIIWNARPLHHFVSAPAWKRWNTCCAGKNASATAHKFGHRQMCLMGQNWLVHRIVWKWTTGNDPIELDHINGDGADNRWANLREAGYAGNARNRKSINKLGLKGVRRVSKSQRFAACIRINGKLVALPGSYLTPEEAHAAYCAAAKEHFGEFWSDGHR